MPPPQVAGFERHLSNANRPDRAGDDYAPVLVAPPKRKTGSGRVTPKGTKPGALPSAGTPQARARKVREHHDGDPVEASSRYTPKVPKSEKESPRWWPVLMLGLFIVGGILILIKYLGWVPGGQNGSQWWVFAGLVFVLAGLFTATQWR